MKIVWTKSDRHLQFFWFLKKIMMTKSSVNFLSPEPNGQGYYFKIYWSCTTQSYVSIKRAAHLTIVEKISTLLANFYAINETIFHPACNFHKIKLKINPPCSLDRYQRKYELWHYNYSLMSCSFSKIKWTSFRVFLPQQSISCWNIITEKYIHFCSLSRCWQECRRYYSLFKKQ